MRFLEYLFFKYYNWQVRVGNGDIPSSMAVLCMTVIYFLLIFDVFGSISFFIWPKLWSYISIEFVLGSGCAFFLICYALCVIKGKDKKILEKHKDEWKGKKNLWAILLPILEYVWFIASMFIKMLMNRGVL